MYIDVPNKFEHVTTSPQLAGLLDDDFNYLSNILANPHYIPRVVSDLGTTNELVITIDTNSQPLTYPLSLLVIPAHNNTGATTIEINGGGVVTIKRQTLGIVEDLLPDDIAQGIPVNIVLTSSSSAYLISPANRPQVYISDDIAPVVGAQIVITHGLGVIPHYWRIDLVCVIAQFGYNENDVCPDAVYSLNGAENAGIQCTSATTTTITFRIPNIWNGLRVLDPTDGTWHWTTLANWTMRFNIWRFR